PAVADPPAARLRVQATLPACVRPLLRAAAARRSHRESESSRPLLAVGRREARPSRGHDLRRARGVTTPNGTPLLELKEVEKHFPVRRGTLARETGRVHPVDRVTLTIHEA